MPHLLPRFSPFCCSAWLIAGLSSCTSTSGSSASASRAAVLGTYRLVSPYPATSSWRQVPVPDAALEFTADHAIYHVGSTALTADYELTADYVYVTSGTSRLGLHRLGEDTLRQTDAAGNTVNYVRAY